MNNTTDELYAIKNYYGYFINRKGEVWSKRQGKLKQLKPGATKDTYYIVRLSSEGKITTKTIHRLLAETFIPNPSNKPEVNHKNGIKHDNRLENLEWVTKSENRKHALSIGLTKISPLAGTQPIAIRQYNSQNNLINEFKSITEASSRTKINLGNIGACCRKKRARAGGYKWEYVNG